MKTSTVILVAAAAGAAWWWWSKQQQTTLIPPAVAPRLPNGLTNLLGGGTVAYPSGMGGRGQTTAWHVPSFTDASCGCPPGKHNVGIGGCVCA
jgi:hypothetical protein